MSPALIALQICLISAASRVFLKRGLQSSNALTVMVISLVVGWLVLAGFAAVLVPAADYRLEGMLFFAGVGVIAPPVVRYLTYLGVDKVGASRSDLVRGLQPFFAILFAIALLRESVNAFTFLGAALIFAGVALLLRDQSQPADARHRWRRQDLLYPLGAAFTAGAISVARKVGTGLLPNPLLGATVAATSALVVFGLFLLHDSRWRRLTLERRSARYFVLSGACTAATDVLDLLALKHGKVSLVAPLLATTPIFVILFSHLFLRGMEKVTKMLVLGAILVFAGSEILILLAR